MTYTCTINQIGGSTADNGAFTVTMTDIASAFTDKSFKIAEDRLNQLLAILLTAASSGSTVNVLATPPCKAFFC
jgi:hypothetical protein